jgi:hypothetical protein
MRWQADEANSAKKKDTHAMTHGQATTRLVKQPGATISFPSASSLEL